MGLSFTIAGGPRQLIHSRVRVPWDSRPYTVSDSRHSFLSPSTTRRPTYSTPPPHGILSILNWTLLYNHFARTEYKTSAAADTCLRNRCPAMDVSSSSTIPAFRRHVTAYKTVTFTCVWNLITHLKRSTYPKSMILIPLHVASHRLFCQVKEDEFGGTHSSQGKVMKTHKIMTGKIWKKRLLGRPRHRRFTCDIKIVPAIIVIWDRFDSSGSEPVASSCIRG
jgi:hypothetical protein